MHRQPINVATGHRPSLRVNTQGEQTSAANALLVSTKESLKGHPSLFYLRNRNYIESFLVVFFGCILPFSCLVCPGQKKRIAPLSFFHGCRKRRLKH
jgi:hypothetical protein